MNDLICLLLWINGFFTIVFAMLTLKIDDVKITWTCWLYLILTVYVFSFYKIWIN